MTEQMKADADKWFVDVCSMKNEDLRPLTNADVLSSGFNYESFITMMLDDAYNFITYDTSSFTKSDRFKEFKRLARNPFANHYEMYYIAKNDCHALSDYSFYLKWMMIRAELVHIRKELRKKAKSVSLYNIVPL